VWVDGLDSPSTRAPGVGTRPVVLYVAGDHSSRVVFTRIARRWKQLRLVVADGARDGARIALVRRPRLVVMDGRLPDVPADLAVSRLRQGPVPPDVPIVVLHDDDTPDARSRFVRAGASAYLTKPLNVASVDRTVGALLEFPVALAPPLPHGHKERSRR